MTKPASVQLPHYAAKLVDPAPYKVLYGGRSAGRTWTVARLLLLTAAQDRLRVLCVREFQRSMRDSVYRVLRDQIDALNVPGYTWTDTEIRHSNGSMFLFDGLRQNQTKIKGYEGIDRCWVEEAERVSESSWQVLVPTIRKPGAEIWITFNPALETDPTYLRFVTSPPNGAVVVRQSYRDNPWVSETTREQIAHMRRTDPDAAAHVYDGECVTHSESQVLSCKWVVDDFEPNPKGGWEGPYLGADWGFSADPTVLVACWIYDGTLYIEHAIYGYHVDLDRTPELFDGVPYARQHMIRADNSRPETISHVAKQGFNVTGAPKWSGSVQDGIAHLRSYDRIVVHPRNREFEQECRLWRWKVDELSGKPMNLLQAGNDHGPDALRYALAPKIKRAAGPTPQDLYLGTASA